MNFNHQNPKISEWQGYGLMFILLLLFGGTVGGLAFALGAMLWNMVFARWDEILVIILFGAMFGTIPALLTGLAAFLLKLKRSFSDGIKFVGIGTLISGILLGSILEDISLGLLLAGVGFVSSLVFVWALPKPLENKGL